MCPVVAVGTVKPTLSLGLNRVAPTLISLLVVPISVLLEPLAPTVVLARTKLLQCDSAGRLWLAVSMTLRAMARLTWKGPLTVSIMLLIVSGRVGLVKCVVGKFEFLTCRMVRLALVLALIMVVAATCLLRRLIRTLCVLVTMRQPASMRLLVSMTMFELTSRCSLGCSAGIRIECRASGLEKTC